MRTIFKLCVVIVATSFTCLVGQTLHAESGRSGRPGMGGGHHHSGGHGGFSFQRKPRLVGPSTNLDLFGLGAGGAWGGGWGAWYPGYPNDPWGYETGRVPTPPYFAIHPPVYYGKRVGMPYGNSTVTRPPRAVFDVPPSTTLQPVVHIRQPQMIVNPFVVDEEEADEEPVVEEPAAPKRPKAKRDRAKKADPPVLEKSRRKGKQERARNSRGASPKKRKAGKKR